MRTQTTYSNKNKWFELGREVNLKLPLKASTLRPNRNEISSSAQTLNVSVADARTALAVYNGFTEAPNKDAPE